MCIENPAQGFRSEVRLMLRRTRDVWHLVSKHHRWALIGAACVMALTSASNTAVALLLGRLVDAVTHAADLGDNRAELYRTAAWFLGLIAVAYALREALNVLRRYLVENTCTRINRHMTLKLVAHLLRLELSKLSQDKVGALHGRIVRSVDGFVRFLRLSFLDFFPALFTGAFALLAAITKQPLLGLVMLSVLLAALNTCGPPIRPAKKWPAWRRLPRPAAPRRSATILRCRCMAAPRP